jgi:hypothetical protein
MASATLETQNNIYDEETVSELLRLLQEVRTISQKLYKMDGIIKELRKKKSNPYIEDRDLKSTSNHTTIQCQGSVPFHTRDNTMYYND